jgi:hypothetical protein
VLLRFPENTRYTDDQRQSQAVEWIVSQPLFNADYAPAFRSNGRLVIRAKERIEQLLDEKLYSVYQCDQHGIILKRIDSPSLKAESSDQDKNRRCVNKQFAQSLQIMQKSKH